MVLLRPNQSAWIGGISTRFRQSRRVLAVAHTGFGKTVCFVEITRRTLARGFRVVIIAHRLEIVLQIAKALRQAGVPFGWIMAGQPASNDLCLVGMVQTAANRLGKLEQPKLLVIDEAHHATAGSYKKIAEAWQGCFVLGVTASPARTDGAGLGSCFDTMELGPPMRELITRGYLADFTYLAPAQKADLSGIKSRGGDYAVDQLADVMDKAVITGDAIDWYAKRLNGRPAIAFCVSVEHSRHVAAQFSAAGWKSASVDGTTDPAVRADRIAAIGDGRLNVLASCDLISEGTDIPVVAGAILLRPTQSLIIYLQQVGRVLRPKSDGSKAIILDHVGSVFRFGFPDEVREWTLEGRQKRQQAIRVTQCPECYCAHRPALKCPSCGHVYATAAMPRSRKEVDGTLVEVDAARIEALRTTKLAILLKTARTEEALREIARARGFHSRWVTHVLRSRGQHADRAA